MPLQVPAIEDAVILARYPFLPQSSDYQRQLAVDNDITLEVLLDSERMDETRTRGRLRLVESISNKGGVDAMAMRDIHTEEGRLLESFSYSFARLVVCASEQEVLISRWAQAEAERAERLLCVDDVALPIIARTYLSQIERVTAKTPATNLPSPTTGTSRQAKPGGRGGLSDEIWEVGLSDFIEICPRITGERWRLINHEVNDGKVVLGDRRMGSQQQLARLLRERIKEQIMADALLRMTEVTDELAVRLAEAVGMATTLIQQASSERLELSGVEQDDWPPCMRKAVRELEAGINVNHFGRLFLASISATIGLEQETCAGFFVNAPDYNPETTTYQIGHVYERSYTPAGCAKLKLNACCAVQPGDDRLCDQPWLDHPMKYLRSQQRWRMRDAAGAAASEDSGEVSDASTGKGDDALDTEDSA
jgi:DNA primase large subunit